MKPQKLICEIPNQIVDNNFLTSNETSLASNFFELFIEGYFQFDPKF
tara:strand:+ start:633 stop:773 length:141 start_codon:yes stop_codon:yes gene_type:complete